jgi:hypothetical protein
VRSRRAPFGRICIVKALLVTAAAATLLLAGCGGKSVTKTVTVEGPNPPTTSDETSSSSEGQVKVEQARLIYLPDQTGGNFHSVLVLLRNRSDETAIDIGGQISILDEQGQLVQAVEPTLANILPHGEGVWLEDVDLPRPLPHGKLKVQLTAPRFVPDGRSPVSFKRIRYRRDEVGGCTITGVVSNRFTEEKENLQIRVVGFIGSQVVTGETTYADGPNGGAFPRTDTTFKADMFSPALCPPRLDRIQVLPNLSEDKIFTTKPSIWTTTSGSSTSRSRSRARFSAAACFKANMRTSGAAVSEFEYRSASSSTAKDRSASSRSTFSSQWSSTARLVCGRGLNVFTCVSL